MKDKKNKRAADLLGIKKRRLAYMIKKSCGRGLHRKRKYNSQVKKTPKAILFRDIAQVVDVEKLLCDSNEIILSNIGKNITVDQLIKNRDCQRQQPIDLFQIYSQLGPS